MTTKGQPGRVIRIDDETWAEFGQLCEEKGIARATDIRMYVVREVTAWRKEQARQAAIRRRLDSPESAPKRNVKIVRSRKPADPES